MADWISVKDRLPKDNPGKRWLICYKNGIHHPPKGTKRTAPRVGRVLLFAVYSGGAWRFLDLRDKTRLSERVTHWMPLPRLPRRYSRTLAARLAKQPHPKDCG